MSVVISDTIIKLKRYDRSIVKFYPYAGNDSYFITCWLIIKPYILRGQKTQQNCNIKLYGNTLLETLVFDLQNINKLEFCDSSILDFSTLNAVPIARDNYINNSKTTSVKDNIEIVNQYRYGYFEFNLVKLIIPDTTPIFTADPIWLAIQEITV